MMACGRLMLMCEREGLGQKHHPSDGWCSHKQAWLNWCFESATMVLMMMMMVMVIHH
jgi:hypothetical protein